MTVQSWEWLSSANIEGTGRHWKCLPPCISSCFPAALPFPTSGEMAKQIWHLLLGDSNGKSFEFQAWCYQARAILASWAVSDGHTMKREGGEVGESGTSPRELVFVYFIGFPLTFHSSALRSHSCSSMGIGKLDGFQELLSFAVPSYLSAGNIIDPLNFDHVVIQVGELI